MKQQLINDAEEIIDIFRYLFKEFRAQILKETCSCGFTVPQMMLIHELFHKPGITLNELSKKLSLSKSTVSGIVERLEKQGYVTKEIPEENKRIVRISLSENKVNETNFKDIKTKYLVKLLKDLNEEELEKILWAFRKLYELSVSNKEDK